MAKRSARMNGVDTEISPEAFETDDVCSDMGILNMFLVYLDMQVRNIQTQDAVSGSMEDRSLVLQAELRGYRSAMSGEIPKTWLGYQQRFFATIPGNEEEVNLYRKLRAKYGDCE